jgi:hypothetical protein
MGYLYEWDGTPQTLAFIIAGVVVLAIAVLCILNLVHSVRWAWFAQCWKKLHERWVASTSMAPPSPLPDPGLVEPALSPTVEPVNAH